MNIIHNEFVEPINHGEEEITTSFCYIDNVWVRLLNFKKKGMRNNAHKHVHDHATLLAHGSLKATVDGQETIFKAPCMILVLKDQVHFFESLEDNTVAYCVHGIREDDGTGPIVSPEMIPKGASVMEVTNKYGAYAK